MKGDADVSGLFTRYILKPGKRADFLRLLEPLCRHVERNEPGTTLYLLHVDRDRPDVAWLYARFGDGTAKKSHLSSEIYRTAMAAAAPLIDSIDDLDVTVLAEKVPPAGGGD